MGQNMIQDVVEVFKHSLIIRITVAAHYSHTSNYLLSKGHPLLPVLKKLGKIENQKKNPGRKI